MRVNLDSNYTAVCHRGEGDLWSRALYLEAAESETDTFKHLAIYFLDQPSTDRGYVNPANGYVVPRLPASDFDAIFRLVTSGAPLSANWFAGDDAKILWFQLTVSTFDRKSLGAAPLTDATSRSMFR